MKLINTDGMAFIGPGSEWFWTALSGIILAITFIAIYRQLKLQRSREAIDQVDAFEREWATERMCRIRLNALIAYRDASDPADLDVGSIGLIAIYWEKVASLVRRGHIDPQLLWHISGFNCVAWWLILGPSVRRARTDEGDPTTSADFEWLAGTMSELDRKAGVPALTEARVAADIGTRIALNMEALRIEEELRTPIVAIPRVEPAAAVTPAPTGTADGSTEGTPRT